MVDYKINCVGESSFEIEWLGKKPRLNNMKTLRKLYDNMEFISTSGRSKQCSQFGADFKRALQNSLGNEFEIDVRIGHFAIYGFVREIDTDRFVYFSVEDLRDNDCGFNSVLYRTAENDTDYRGGHNNFCHLEDLDISIRNLLERGW